MEEIIAKAGTKIICENGTFIVEPKNMKEILHIHVYTPSTPTWLFENG